MKKLVASIVCVVAIAALAGCTTYESNYPAQSEYDSDRPISYYQDSNSCYARDEKGRRWEASGRRACHHALHKCRQWHDERGINNGRCWVGG